MSKQSRSRKSAGGGRPSQRSDPARHDLKPPEATGTFSTREGDEGASKVPPVFDPPPSGVGVDTRIGAVLDGRYQIEAVIGEGSMGTVYRCRHTVMDKQVAVKILHRELAHDPAAVHRFVTEAKAASAIGSEHIVGTLDFGTLADGCTYFTMEYLEGRTLGERLDDEPLLPFPEIFKLARQIIEGLDAAHLAGVVHRDLKPDNLFLVHRGAEPSFVKILDFGIAKIASVQSDMTRSGSVFGTPHYMAPEQAAGRATDQRSDIYSLGVIFYELACGQVPFRAETALGVLALHTKAAPPPLGESMPEGRALPAGFDALVERCLEKDPAERYQEMGELLFELERVEHGDVPFATKAQSTEARGERLRAALAALKRVPTRVALLAGAGLMLIALGAIVSASSSPDERPAAPSAERPAPAPKAPEPPRAAPEPEKVAEPAPPAPTSPTPATTVDLILFPLDAHAFRGEVDLGAMPVSVPVMKGEVIEIWVKRKGYVSRRILVRDTQTRRVVGLRPTREWLEKAERLKARRAAKRAAEAGAATHATDADERAGDGDERVDDGEP